MCVVSSRCTTRKIPAENNDWIGMNFGCPMQVNGCYRIHSNKNNPVNNDVRVNGCFLSCCMSSIPISFAFKLILGRFFVNNATSDIDVFNWIIYFDFEYHDVRVIVMVIIILICFSSISSTFSRFNRKSESNQSNQSAEPLSILLKLIDFVA